MFSPGDGKLPEFKGRKSDVLYPYFWVGLGPIPGVVKSPFSLEPSSFSNLYQTYELLIPEENYADKKEELEKLVNTIGYTLESYNVGLHHGKSKNKID